MRNEQIKRIVERLVKKYKTSDPYELAACLGIRVEFWNYPPELNGLYQYVERTQHIYINANLDEFNKSGTCAHELGHAILHRTYNCTFLSTHTLNNMNKYEIEANIFAAYLLTYNKNLLEFQNCTYKQIAATLCIPEEYIKLINR